jgi:hypothetical protein
MNEFEKDLGGQSNDLLEALSLGNYLIVLMKIMENVTVSFVIPFYLQSAPVHSANSVKRIQWHAGGCSLALLCNSRPLVASGNETYERNRTN